MNREELLEIRKNHLIRINNRIKECNKKIHMSSLLILGKSIKAIGIGVLGVFTSATFIDYVNETSNSSLFKAISLLIGVPVAGYGIYKSIKEILNKDLERLCENNRIIRGKRKAFKKIKQDYKKRFNAEHKNI